MAPTYKLIYFDARAVAEPIRYLLSYGGAEFEDNRVQKPDWPKLKPSTPFGKMPLLEVDGKLAHQTSAICRYLAKQFKLIGSDDWEALQIDAVVDTVTDLRLAITGYFLEPDQAVKAKKKEPLFKETLPLYLPKLEKLVKDNKGHFVNGKLTWADLHFAALHDFLSSAVGLGKPLTADYPHLKVLVDKVHALPAIKAWVARRPVTDL